MAVFEKAPFKKSNYEGSKIEKLAPIVAKWEGGYVNDPIDKGGATNMGVTVGAWKLLGYDKNGDGIINNADMKLLSKDDFKFVLRKYWDKWQADQIKNQSIANILVDWYWGSGKWGIVIPQRLLGFSKEDCDGIVGEQTLKRLNAEIDKDAEALFDKIFAARVKFLDDIVKNNPSQKRFIKGWKNRLNDFKFQF
ncbi:MAG: glycosyl hydrolase 108 family protein [Flavobacterium sp.]|uniref:glycoside hydrolase family 108 protein n=1 Tax=Flavobacterium sp. TaxID=239 RepID=UPI002B494FC5|nr:glycosyl hydrolase 108 family protein [Flavobacterium sp.]WRH74133.1 MAG: glycosyl hydrolase 108 family protein [Flavobacterium sp.]